MLPLSRFLVRAPLLPLKGRARHPLLERALAHLPADAKARKNYARRAAFRPTPHGVFAGVLVGELGSRTRVATGEPHPHLTVSWATRAARARAILEDRTARELSRLRVAPSLLVDARHAAWLAFGDDARAESRAAELDEPLAAAIAAAKNWAPWPEVRAAAGADDEWLLRLVDDGLLVSSLEPPLVGPQEITDEWEGAHVVLTFDGTVTLPRATVERAAGLVPLFHSLQAALAPPIAERDAQNLRAVEVASEIFGAGALDLAALARGEYGVLFDEDAPPQPPTPPALLALLAEAVARGSADFSSEELQAVTPFSPPPATCELFLQPTRDARGRGWLVGLHAPAGASWGRFAHALGAPMELALDELVAAESRARPGEARCDVAFAPTRELADLAAHPRVRPRVLALTGWPEGAIPVEELELVAGALEPLALRASGSPICPSPLMRLRSTTAPAGAHRLLVSWSLERQHAPWAFGWGPLADLPRLPRVTVDGFVVAPASWRLPASDLRRWRKQLEVPRHVMVGEGDELMLVDLDEKSDLGKLRGRAWEVWPPLDDTPDRDGRRVEAVIALVDEEPRAEAAIATARAGRVPPPHVEGPAPGWQTFKLFGAPDRADAVLLGVVRPYINDALASKSMSRWFYLRYLDAPGRPHVRLRVFCRKGGDARLDEYLAPARAAGDVVAVERAEYFREHARYGRENFPLVEEIFQLDSELALSLLESVEDPLERVLLSLDTLASSLPLSERRALAGRRRDAHEGEWTEDLSPEYRARQRRLLELLAAPPDECLRARAALPRIDEKLFAPLLHLSVVRHDPQLEASAYYFWERALDGLSHRR